jgi:AcrR family transcriptional regulator
MAACSGLAVPNAPNETHQTRTSIVAKDTWWNLPEPKRKRVLQAAMEEFGQRGFSAGSLNVIARQAGIAKGSLFQYFDDKLDLFTTTVGATADGIQHAILDGLDTEDVRFFDLLRTIVDRWLDYFRSHPVERAVAFAAATEIDPDARAALRTVTNTHYVEAFGPLLKRAIDRGEFVGDPAELLTFAILLMRHLDSAPFIPYLDPVLGLYDRPPHEVREIAQHLVSALERAYAKENDA